MPEIDRYRSEDQRGVDALYRRVFGPDAAAASRLRWDWQYRRNPNNPEGGPLLWVAREGPTIIGHYATMPVRLSLGGKELNAAWGTDAMVAPERQRRGVGEELFRVWDRSVGVALGLGLSEPSSRLLTKLHFPDVTPIPALVKPLTRRAVRLPKWPMAVNRFVSAVTLPIVRVAARVRPLRADIEPIRRFDATFTDLWERLTDRFELAVRRDATYLNWKFIEPPHVRYSVAALKRDGRSEGYVVYRHAQEPRGRVTLLVDFLADTHDEIGFKTLLRWVDAEARLAGSDKIRCFAAHLGFRRIMRQSGYFQMRQRALELVAKVNAVTVPAKFYKDTDNWHVTLGDSDQDVSIRDWD
jgi:GNAT superfamily N-acetyltransferase